MGELRRLMALTLVMLLPCMAHAQEPLVVAKDGRALAQIVTADRGGVAQFAAQELKRYLDETTGTEFEIVAEAAASPRVFVGRCQASDVAGLDVSRLKRDGYYRGVVGDDLFLLGRDADGPVKMLRYHYNEVGTLFAVYDFLEDVCGVRWMKAGPHGEVVPKIPTLAVERAMVKEEPFYLDRSLSQFGLHGYDYPDADKHATLSEQSAWHEPDRELLGFRLRWETQKFVAGCHSSHYLEFDERFADEHPEWFVLLKNGERGINMPRGSYLCYSHPGVIQAFADDARAYFSGQPPESRGLKTWRKCGYGDEFMVDPHDSYPYCQCEDCQRVFRADPEQDFSEIIFGAVAKIAEAVSDFEGKYITTLAYGPKRKPPKTVVLPKNVRVRLCVRGPIHHTLPGSRTEQMALIKQWSERMEGDLVLWLYTNAARPGGKIPGVPEVEPHAIGEFLRAVKPYVMGAYFENESTAETFRFLDEYVTMKLLWNPDQDVDALLEDYFTSFYGSAAEPIKQLYAKLEELWRKTYTLYGGDHPRYASRIDLWEKVYTEQELSALDELVKQAETLAKGDQAYEWRVALVRDEMLGRLHANRHEYERTLGVAKQTETTCYRAQVEPGHDGLLPLQAWDDVPHEVLGPAMTTEKLYVLTRYKTQWTPDALHLLIECEDPDLASSATAVDREVDDPNLWKDQTAEFFVTYHDERIMSEAQYQVLINDRGVIADHSRALGESDWSWSSEAVVKVSRDEHGWHLRVAVPLDALGIADPMKIGRVSFNVVRHRPRRGQEPQYYAWAPASQKGGWGESVRHGQLVFSEDVPPPVPVNLLRNGALDEANEKGQWFAEWLVPSDNRDNIFRDEEVRWDGAAALRLEAKEPETVTLLQYLEPLKPGTAYRFKCKVKTEDIQADEPGHNGAYVNFYAPGFNRFVPMQALTGTTDWRNVEFEATTAPADKWPEEPKFYVRLKIAGCTGTAWFEEASLVEVQR